MVQSKQKGKRGDIVALKGKTTFELTDVNTGEVEVIEDSNMITNGLQEFLTTYGYWGCDILNNDTIGNNSLWVNLLGGLFLFDTALDEDVNNIFMPAGVKMIGNGSKDVSNSGAVTALGSYSTTESGLQSDGSIKFVYDFSTAQANGTIACACLTSKIGGYIGMGNSDEKRIYNDDYAFMSFSSDWNHIRTSNIDGSTHDSQRFLYASYNDNAVYLSNPYNIKYDTSHAEKHWSTTKKIQILKVKAGFTSVSIKERLLLNQVAETYDIDIPQDILTYMGTSTILIYISADTDGNVFVIFNTHGETLSNGSFCWIMKIDRVRNVTQYKFTNNVGSTIFFNRQQVVFNGEYMFVYTYNDPYKLYGIKYSDSTQIIENPRTISSRYTLFNIDKNLIGMFGNSYGSSGYYAPFVYDVVNNELRYCNGKGSSNSSSDLYIPFIDKKGVYIYVYLSNASSGDSFRVLKDPRYLATINNLAEPVVKTSSKTMKVTYTLTFEG